MFDGHGTEGPPSTCSRLPQGAQMTTLTIGTAFIGECRLKPNRLANSRSGRYLFRRDAVYGNQTKTLIRSENFSRQGRRGTGIGSYSKDQVVFSQGDPADAVFYIQKGKVKV